MSVAWLNSDCRRADDAPYLCAPMRILSLNISMFPHALDVIAEPVNMAQQSS